jgi:hypothetical protein
MGLPQHRTVGAADRVTPENTIGIGSSSPERHGRGPKEARDGIAHLAGGARP